MCDLLRPEELPVDPGQGGNTSQTPEFGDDGCTNTVQQSDVFNILTVLVARQGYPFSEFTPPDGGELTEISGLPAWVGRSTSDEKSCSAVFGAAEGNVSVVVVDETERGVDPCETATELAEIVISRTPPPNE